MFYSNLGLFKDEQFSGAPYIYDNNTMHQGNLLSQLKRLYVDKAYEILYYRLSTWSFPEIYHKRLHKLWFDAHYDEAAATKPERPLSNVARYRIRQRYPLPSTIYDGEKMSYSLRESSRRMLSEFFAQVSILPNAAQKRNLAIKTRLSLAQITNWFKNRRQRRCSTMSSIDPNVEQPQDSATPSPKSRSFPGTCELTDPASTAVSVSDKKDNFYIQPSTPTESQSSIDVTFSPSIYDLSPFSGGSCQPPNDRYPTEPYSHSVQPSFATEFYRNFTPPHQYNLPIPSMHMPTFPNYYAQPQLYASQYNTHINGPPNQWYDANNTVNNPCVNFRYPHFYFYN